MLNKLNQPKGSTIGVLRDGRSIQEGFDELSAGLNSTGTNVKASSGASQALLPQFMRKLVAYKHGVDGSQKQFVVHGYGSSVSNGATLPDKTTQAPVSKFFEYMNKAINPGGIYPITFENRSVDGSNINDFLVREWPKTETDGVFPDIAVFAYGMNDFPSAQYNAGMTFGENGFKQRLRQAIQKVRDNGGDVVILTTPHPYIENYDWTMPPTVDMIWPKRVDKPVSGEQMIPSLAESNVTFEYAGRMITQGVRFLRGNDAMREVAVEMGVILIDAEKYWFEAVGKYGNAMLYDAGQLVHPNLFGHQQSYWKAMEVFWDNVNRNGWIAPDVARNLTLDVGGTGLVPLAKEADIDMMANGIREKAFVKRDKAGRIIREVTMDGHEVSTTYTVQDPTSSSPGYKLEWHEFTTRTKGLFSANEKLSIGIPNRTEGKLLVNGWSSSQTGWTQLAEYMFSNRDGKVTISKIAGLDTTVKEGSGSEVTLGGERFFSLEVSGSNLVITSKMDNTSLKYRLERFGG